jgi:hypothetical protein
MSAFDRVWAGNRVLASIGITSQKSRRMVAPEGASSMAPLFDGVRF